jgi:DNA-binding Lrp family transcriptional regulator
MFRIDSKDKHILYQLDLHARQSFSEISKKVELPKSNVRYRIKRLEAQGIIRNYYAVIDSFRLGYNAFKIYISLENTDEKIEKDIIHHFVNNKDTWAVFTNYRWFDLDVIVWIKNRQQFKDFWTNTQLKYAAYIKEYILSYYSSLRTYRYAYLLDEEKRIDPISRDSIMIGDREDASCDMLDFTILTILSSNARISVIDLAKRAHCSIPQVRYRLKKLMDQQIIKAFRANIDISKLGYHLFKVDMHLSNYDDRQNIINFLEANPHLIGIDETIGLSDLELEFHLKDTMDLITIMNEISHKFPHSIKTYRYLMMNEVYKLTYLPESYR